ncbi:MAG: hypothetical protein KM310_07275 [Clostridiales bacterium]|nr:hypothetical protein [Clostridiales bacterium]
MEPVEKGVSLEEVAALAAVLYALEERPARDTRDTRPSTQGEDGSLWAWQGKLALLEGRRQMLRMRRR